MQTASDSLADTTPEVRGLSEAAEQTYSSIYDEVNLVHSPSSVNK